MDKPAAQTELRILLLEDEPTDAELTEDALREADLSFTAKRVDTREAFIQALDEFKPDIVLADYKLPTFDGGSAVKIVRQQYPDVPVIMVTGAVGDETAIELLKLGAMDYVLKDRLARLGPAVRRALSQERSTRARKAAEKALLESEARYRRITEGLTDYLYTVRIENGRAVETKQSPACVTVTGYKAEEFAADPYLWIHMVAPEDRKSVIEHVRQILEGKDVPPLEHRIIRKDGTLCWVSDTTILFKGASGKLLSYDGVIKDITERKQAEEKIRESEAKYRAVVETTSDWLWETNEQGVYTYASPRVQDLLGYTSDEITGKTPFDLMPAAEASRVSAVFSSFAAERKPFQLLENTCLHKDGHTVIVETSGVPIFDDDGAFRGYRGVDRNITERKRAEIRIQKLTRLYATLSQTNQTIVRTTNRDELFSSICESAVVHGKFLMAWVGLVDEATRMVNPVCQYGAEQGYLANTAISIDDVPEGRGPTGISIRENCVSYVNDYTTDERVRPWRETALKHGFHSSAAIPLRFKGRAIGALTLYAEEPDFFDSDQLNLLEEMAKDISFALDGFEREALRRQAEEERETALHKLRKALEDSIRVAASISEVRDPYTSGHQQRVSQLAVAIAREMGFPEAQVEGIRFGSLIHDVGKIGVPAEILSKPARLMPLEMQLIQIHPKAGYEIVKDIDLPWPVAQMILQHHERLNGSGYPSGMKDSDIIPEARIIAVADTVEAMSSHRPYRPSLGMDAALAAISAASGVRYDKQAVDACIRLIREKGFVFNPN